MTVIARRIISIPERSASDTWKFIVNLLVPEPTSSSTDELMRISGIASSLISTEVMKGTPIVVYGSGPRVRIYCLFGEDAITGEGANEQSLPFVATEGDWKMSIPCPADDLNWIQEALSRRSTRITVRDMDETVETSNANNKDASISVNLEAFLGS